MRIGAAPDPIRFAPLAPPLATAGTVVAAAMAAPGVDVAAGGLDAAWRRALRMSHQPIMLGGGFC